jgi:hypothetical protein
MKRLASARVVPIVYIAPWRRLFRCRQPSLLQLSMRWRIESANLTLSLPLALSQTIRLDLNTNTMIVGAWNNGVLYEARIDFRFTDGGAILGRPRGAGEKRRGYAQSRDKDCR